MPKAKPKTVERYHSDFGTPERAQHGEGVVEETMTAGIKRRRYLSAWERLAASGDISEGAARAAERFNQDFQTAGMVGHIALCSAERVDGQGRPGEPTSVINARARVWEAYDALPGDLAKQAVWWLVGVEYRTEKAVGEIKQGIGSINRHKLAGVLHVALDSLAKHYGFE